MLEKEREKELARHENEDLGWKPLVYKDLTCRDCKFVFKEPNRILSCAKYDMKPGYIIYGENCEKKEVEK